MGIVDKKYYKGYKIRINNSSKVPHFRLLPKDKIIEYNPDFFSKLTPNQEYFLLEWAIRSRIVKNPFQCDIKTRDLYLSKGYNMDEIFQLYSTMKFASNQIKRMRYDNLFQGKYKPETHHILIKLVNFLGDSLKKLHEWIQTGK